MRQKRKQCLVLGLGRFGRSVACAMTELGHEVMAVDRDSQPVEDVADLVASTAQADATDEEVFRSFDPSSFDIAVVAIGTNVRDSVMLALLCKEAGIPMVVAKAMDDLHAKLLTKIGVDQVVFPERDMGQRLAQSLVSPGLLDVMELADGYRIAEVVTPAAWSGRTLEELAVRRKYGVSIISVKRERKLIASPGADTQLKERDILVVLGQEDDIAAIDGL